MRERHWSRSCTPTARLPNERARVSAEKSDVRPLPAGARERPDPVIGRTLAGRYRVDDLIARGGMARVYRARDDRLDRDVAVKVLSRPYADDPAFTKRFLGEARAAASLSHPNLVHVYDSGSDGALHYIVMELLDHHRSLRQVLAERGRLPAGEVLPMAAELLAGLRAVHERGLVHCDVKAANVMLGPGPVKLIDFGIARSPREPGSGTTSIGSLQYMAPEQLRGEPFGPAADLFSAGVVLYEALTGQLPFAARTPEELADAHRAGRVRPPSTLAAGISPRLDGAVIQALRPAPEHRFGSAGAMATALGPVSADAPADETRPVRTPPPARHDRGYVPPPAPPFREGVRPVASRAAPSRPTRRTRIPRLGRLAGPLGSALVLTAVALVVVFLVVPLIQSGRDGGGGAATPTPVGPTPPPGQAIVPDTIGRSADEAIDLANAAGLNWRLECNEDPSLPEGIIDQEPAANTPVTPGSRFVMYSARFADCD